MNSTESKIKVQTIDFTKFRMPALLAFAALFVAVVVFAGWSVFELFSARLNTTIFEAALAMLASVGVAVLTLFVVLTTNHMPTKGAGAIILIAWIGVTFTLVGLNTALRGGLFDAPDALSGIGQVVAGVLAALALIPVFVIPLTMRDRTHYDSALAASSKYLGFVTKGVMVLASAIASGYFGVSRGIDPMLAVVLGVVLESCFLWAYASLTKAGEKKDAFDAWLWRVVCVFFGGFLTVVTIETVATLSKIDVPIVHLLGEVGASIYVSAIGLAVITAVTAHIIASFVDFKDVDGDGKPDWIIGGRRIGETKAGATIGTTKTPQLAKDGETGATVVKLPKGDPANLHKPTKATCIECGKKFAGDPKQAYCSASCKNKAYRRRKKSEAGAVVEGEVEDGG